MSFDINMLRAKLRKALDAYGKSNGQACPKSESNLDPLLHELYITSEAANYFKARHERARLTAMGAAFDNGEIDEAVTRVIKHDAGESMSKEAGLYSVVIEISRAARKLDPVALRNHLTVTCKLSPSQVDKAFQAATSPANPAKRVKVVAR